MELAIRRWRSMQSVPSYIKLVRSKKQNIFVLFFIKLRRSQQTFLSSNLNRFQTISIDGLKQLITKLNIFLV